MDNLIIKRALISVSDKTNLIEIANFLQERNIEIFSTGGTFKHLKNSNIKVNDVSQYTNFPEIMDGRVKTLHPKIYGGILARKNIDNLTLKEHSILKFDLVIVNLYPFEKTISQKDFSLQSAIENIDIGGPCMLRASAKNYHNVAVITNIKDYEIVKNEIKNNNSITLQTRFKLAIKAFKHTSFYDNAIFNYFESLNNENNDFEEKMSLTFTKKLDMRYGENPHQKAGLYQDNKNINNFASVVNSKQVQGKSLSYNNIADADSCLECVLSFKDKACVIVKHSNPCGVATSKNSILEAYKKAFSCDKMSAFGGIIAFNDILDKETLQEIFKNQFVEVILARDISNDAKILAKTKPNVRILSYGFKNNPTSCLTYKKINGGVLVQDQDFKSLDLDNIKIVSQRKPSNEEYENALFAWNVVKYVKSNAIVYAKENMTYGIGAGQMSRVFSAKIASSKASDAKLNLHGSSLASDAFFPFRDGIDEAFKNGVTCIIQPGGSIKDNDIIKACNEHNIAMIFTGMRHFRH